MNIQIINKYYGILLFILCLTNDENDLEAYKLTSGNFLLLKSFNFNESFANKQSNSDFSV